MICLLISEENLIKMIQDGRNMSNDLKCSFLNCDLNEDRIIISGQSDVEDEESHIISIKHVYIRGGPGSSLSTDRKEEIRMQFGCGPSNNSALLQTDSRWRKWLKLCEDSPPKKKKPRARVSVLRRVKVANLLKALETIAKIVSDSEAPDVKVIEFKIGGDGKFTINIKCAEPMDHLWFGGHVNVGDPVVDIYDKRFSVSATISV